MNNNIHLMSGPEGNSLSRETAGLVACEQALCLGKNSKESK